MNLVKELAVNPAPGLHRPHALGHAWRAHGGQCAPPCHGKAGAGPQWHYRELPPLREALQAKGRVFESETDTEVVAHLVSDLVEGGLSPVDAVKAALPQLRGPLAIAFREHPEMLIGARLGSPLVLGYGDGETYLGSDALALAPLTQRITYLEEGDWVVIRREGWRFTTRTIIPSRARLYSGASAAAVKKVISATSCRRKSTISPPSWRRRCKAMCAVMMKAWPCRRSISTCRLSSA
jgi:glucosamine--fructose-6-phosphate aminotransferase (isomerizing)